MRSTTLIRTLTEMADLEAVCHLFGATWPSPDGHPPTTVGLLKALAYNENYVAGAFLNGQMIGAAVAFLAIREGRVTLFSNQIAVEPAQGGNGVGFALQHHMREWALGHNIHEVNWTFDPLIVRSAYFFIHKVGAQGIEYLSNFYGGSYDPGNDASDRIFAVWQLDRTQGDPGDLGAAPFALVATESGEPTIDVGAQQSDRFAMRLPADMTTLRCTDSALAARWREGVRSILVAAFANGYRLVDVSRDGLYVIAR